MMVKKSIILTFILITFWSSIALASIVKEVKIMGNERVNKDYILSLIPIKNGSKYNEDLISLAIKNLYNTDRFSDIQVSFDGNVLTFKIQENPMVNNLIIVGNKKIKEKLLLQELSLSKNLPISERKLTSDKKRIKDLYLKNGYLSTTVTTNLKYLKYNRVDVIFNVNEGKKSTISSIKFIGNKVFSSSTLKKVILTKENRWWRLLNPNYIYDSNRISYDAELLRQYYNDEGYIDFNLLSSFVVINRNNQYQLVFNISEGQRFTFANTKLEINANRLLPYKNKLIKLLDIKPGTWFSKKEIDKVVENLQDKISNLGITLVEVSPKITLNTFLKKVYVVFEINNSQVSTIERINITGNTRTYDNVIRRSMSVREGDAFTPAVINKTRVNVYNTGYFSDVNVTSQPGSMPDKTILNVNVHEQSTGYISLGGGYSTYDGFMIQTTLTEQNIMGSGNGINLSASVSQRQVNIDATFSKPYLFDRKIHSSLRVFDMITDNTKYSDYKMNQIGVSPSIGYKLSENLKQSFTYLLANKNIFDVSKDAPLPIKQSAGNKIASIITHDLEYDRRDNVIYPTKGYLINFTTDLAGLGGDIYYLRDTLSASLFQSIYGNVVFSFISSVGYINKIRSNKMILISDKFFLGGTSLRGFDWSGIGPRDPKSDDALGGNYMFRTSLQVDFPIPLVDNFGLLFHVFNDNGAVYDIDSFNKDIVKFSELRSSIGFGISWRSPFGVIALDWGWPIRKKPIDKLQRFLLSFGTRF